MTSREDLAARLVHFTARLSTLLPWVEERAAREGATLRDHVETVVALAHQIHHVYEPFLRPSEAHTSRAARREALADTLTDELDRWAAGQAPERRIVADYWRLVASLIWATASHHQFLRDRLGVSDTLGAETRRQQRFSTQNVHEAWALAAEGYYDPSAVQETTRWLLLHVRDCARRDYRLALLSKAPAVGISADTLGDPALSQPSIGALSFGPDSVMLTEGAQPLGFTEEIDDDT